VYSLRYAHTYYGDSDQAGLQQHAGGLIFPGDRPPNYFDFAYFSFVIGMTCQVSDVQITSRRMRRITLFHSILSFGFNTLILALLINTVSGLL
jgi:Predicted membrane protein